MGDEGCFPLMAILDSYVIILLANIKFSEVTSIFQLVYKVRNERERVCVVGSIFVEVLIVLTGTEFGTLFLTKKKRDT